MEHYRPQLMEIAPDTASGGVVGAVCWLALFPFTSVYWLLSYVEDLLKIRLRDAPTSCSPGRRARPLTRTHSTISSECPRVNWLQPLAAASIHLI
jgi:hypothetical protein